MRPHRYSYRTSASNPTATTIHTEGGVIHLYRARSGVLVTSTQAEATDFASAVHYLLWSYKKQAKRIIKRLREGDPV